MPLYVIREGDGERDALPALVYGLRDHLGLDLPHHHSQRHSWKRQLLTMAQVVETCSLLRATEGCDAALLTRDADQDQLPHADCPKHTAPEIAGWVRDQQLPFPVAVVLFYKEYETLFVSGADGLAGRTVTDSRNRSIAEIRRDAAAPSDPEHFRDAKGWVRGNLVGGYKPTLFQLPLTRMLDHDDLAARGLPSYRRLSSALRFLADHAGVTGAAYPPTPAGGS